LGSAFLPYYILRKYYASSTAPGIALRILFGLAVAFLLHLLAAKLILSISFNQFIDTSYQLLINLSFYGIGFYFIRYSYLKRVQTKESEIRERERLITVYQEAFPKKQVFGQLARIEEMIQHNPPAALKEIEGFCDELQQMIYSIPNARNE